MVRTFGEEILDNIVVSDFKIQIYYVSVDTKKDLSELYFISLVSLTTMFFVQLVSWPCGKGA